MSVVGNWLVIGGIVALIALVPYNSQGASLPDTVVLDSLAKHYDKAPFNHAKHISLAKDCGVCHHHTTGTMVDDPNCVRCHSNSSESKIVACKGCHAAEPFSAEALRAKESDKKLYHTDKPGLKGAYHLSCRGCHEKMGGPVDCESCHKRTKQGDALYNGGQYAPKKAAGNTAHH